MKTISKHLLILSIIVICAPTLNSQTIELNSNALAKLTIEQKLELTINELADLDFKTLIELSDELADYSLSNGVSISVEKLASLDLEEIMVIAEKYENYYPYQEFDSNIFIPLIVLSELELSSLMKVSDVEVNTKESITLQAQDVKKLEDI